MIRSSNKKEQCLIIYDIAENRKRRKLVNILESYGVRVQKSAFEVVIDSDKYKRLINEIKSFINQFGENEIRVYKMHHDYEVICFDDNKAFMTEAVIFI